MSTTHNRTFILFTCNNPIFSLQSFFVTVIHRCVKDDKYFLCLYWQKNSKYLEEWRNYVFHISTQICLKFSENESQKNLWLKSIHFKKTVARSSIFSKLWYFLTQIITKSTTILKEMRIAQLSSLNERILGFAEKHIWNIIE